MDGKLLRNYARLIARSGINVVKGQEVIIRRLWAGLKNGRRSVCGTTRRRCPP